MLIQATSNIASTSNIVSKAINIQSVKSGINSFLTLSSNQTKLQYGKSNLLALASLICSGLKISYIKPNITTNSQGILSKTKTYSTAKADIRCSSILKCYYFDRDIQVALKSYIPSFMRKSKVFNELLKVFGNEFTKRNALLKDLVDQFYIDTATWGLDYWENDLGIKTNSSLNYEQRREKIKFKLQVTNTTITKDFFKKIMDRYYSCSISEDFDNSKVSITILGKRGIPPRLQEMVNDAEEFLPAHLVHEFIFTYLPWDELEQSNLNWNQIENYTWDELLTSFLI